MTTLTRALLAVVLALIHVVSLAQPQSLVDRFEKRQHSLDGFTLPYRLFVPAGYDPAVEYPLVVTLHGSGQSGSDNESHIQVHRNATTWAESEAQEENPAFIVAPQAPVGGTFALMQGDQIPLGSELATTIDLLDSLAIEFNIDLDRVYVTGLSMGGLGTFELLIHEPDRFAAAVPMSAGYWLEYADRIVNIPLFVFHGEQDPAIPSIFSRQIVFALEDAGRSVVYTECGPFSCRAMSEAELDSAFATRPDLIYTGYEEGGHVIWVESYDNPRLHDWLFQQHRLTPNAIQFSAPVNYPTLDGTTNVAWTSQNAGDSLEVWFSGDHGSTWQLVKGRIPNTGSFSFDTESYADTPFGLIRLLLVGSDGLVYAQQISEPFVIDNSTETEPVLELSDYQFRPRREDMGQVIHYGLYVPDSAMTLRFRTGDAESSSLDASLEYSEDGGATFSIIDEFTVVTSHELRPLEVDLAALPNTSEAQFRLSVSDEGSTVSATTPIFYKDTPRLSSSYVEQVEGNGDALISINFVVPERLTNHTYRIDFEVAGTASAKNWETTDSHKTYSVTDVDLGVQVLRGFPVSNRESPLFDGIRLSIQDPPKEVDDEKTGWITGDTDQEVVVLAESPTQGQLLATAADYRISITEEVVDTSLAMLGFPPTPMRFTVENVTEGELRHVIFSDRRSDGIPTFVDLIYILEEDDNGQLVPAWFLEFGSASEAPESGDVFEIVTRKPIAHGDAFEFVGAIGVAVEDEAPVEDDFRLGRNYPNPFSQATTIPYRLREAANVELVFFNVLGQRVASLDLGIRPAGEHEVHWDPAYLPSGTYVYRLKAGDFIKSRTMVLVK